jgi:hypothetical protein
MVVARLAMGVENPLAMEVEKLASGAKNPLAMEVEISATEVAMKEVRALVEAVMNITRNT